MTDTTTELLPVAQIDRDAVQRFHRTMAERLMLDLASPDRPQLGEDEGDAGTLVQAFARHRLAAAGGGPGERQGQDAATWANSIKGVKPADQFIALDRRLFEDCITRALSSCLPADPDVWKLVPAGDPVPLNECPPGPFEFEGSLGFRSEYATTLDAPRRHQVDAYTFESGEYFWGGTSKAEARGKLIVQPLALVEQRRSAAA